MRKMRGIVSDRRLCPPVLPSRPIAAKLCLSRKLLQRSLPISCQYPSIRAAQTLQKPRAETQLVGNRSGGEDGKDNEGKTPAVYNSTKNKREL